MRNQLILCAFIIYMFPAFGQGNNAITRLGHFPLTGFVNDVTGFYDETLNKEFAVAGSSNGVWIVDVTDPASPVQAAFMSNVPGFDLKVWKNYLYCVTGSSGANQAKIVDISDPYNPVVVNSFPSAHNIFISDSGYLFAEVPDLAIYNLNPDPVNPQLVWRDNNSGGHDATVIDNYVYDFHGSYTAIYEITYQPQFNMTLLSIIISPVINYHHSGWITKDKNYLYICDEGARNFNPDITVWDISDPANPDFVTQFVDGASIVHNLYIIDDFAYTSYYNSGFRILDVSQPDTFIVVDEYDTNPTTGDSFNGAFGCYPFTRSGNIYISDQTGLYIFSFSGRTTDVGKDIRVTGYALNQNYPNPFNPSTTIKYSIPEQGNVIIKVYDILGNEAATLLNEEVHPGNHEIFFNAPSLPSGTYFYRITSNGYSETRKMILLK